MKKTLFLLFFLTLSFSGFAQYGRLEPLQEGDTTNFVLRTPKETLMKFADSPDKAIREMGLRLKALKDT